MTGFLSVFVVPLELALPLLVDGAFLVKLPFAFGLELLALCTVLA